MMKSENVEKILYENFRMIDSEKEMMCIGLKRSPRLRLVRGDQAYTCHGEIVIGTSFMMFLKCSSKKELLTTVLYIVEHEVLHNFYTADKAWAYGISTGTRTIFTGLAKILDPTRKWDFTNKRSYAAFTNEMAKQDIFIQKETIEQTCHMIQNSLCDGRIERIGSSRSKVFEAEKKVNRVQFWKMQPLKKGTYDISKPGELLTVVLNQILMIATTGLPQKGFYRLYRKTPAEDWVLKVQDYIGLAFHSRNCKLCMEWAIAIEEELIPLIAEAVKDISLEEVVSSLISMLEDNLKAKRGVRETDESEDDDEESEGEYKRLEKKVSGEEEKDDSSDDSKDTEGDIEDTKDDEESKDDKEYKDKKSDKPKSDKELEKEMDDSLEDAKEKAEKIVSNMIELSKMPESERNRTIKKEKGPVALPIREIQDRYRALEGEVIFSEKDFTLEMKHPTPQDVLVHADILRRHIEEIFDREKPPVLKGQKSGRLQGSHSWMLKGGDSEIFMKRQEEDIERLAFFVLQDNSGSMGNDEDSKRYYACRASAIIEEALRNESDHLSMKISAFHAYSSNKVEHVRIKDWDEWQDYSCSYNYYTNESDGYGNKDGYSIRQATAELLQRDEEKKYLIVISDGAPTDYQGGMPMGQQDTAAAIDEARNSGVNVIGLFIESEGSSSNEYEIFESMYKYNQTKVIPSLLGEVLSNVIINACE